GAVAGCGEHGDDFVELDVVVDGVGFRGSGEQGVEGLAECGELEVDAHVGAGGGEEVDHGAGAGRVFDDVGEEGVDANEPGASCGARPGPVRTCRQDGRAPRPAGLAGRVT